MIYSVIGPAKERIGVTGNYNGNIALFSATQSTGDVLRSEMNDMLMSSTVNSSFPVRTFFGNNSANSWWIPIKHTHPWTEKLYLSDLTACRHVGLLYEKFTHTLHDICTLSAVMKSVPGFDALTRAHYDVTGVTFALHYDVIQIVDSKCIISVW